MKQLRNTKKPTKTRSWLISLAAHSAIIVFIALIFILHKKNNELIINHSSLNQLPANTIAHQGDKLAWLKKQSNQNMVLDKTFKASDGLTGYVVHLKNQPDVKSIIYSGNNGNFVVSGNVFDKTQGNISAKNADKYLSHEGYAEIFQSSQQLSGIVQGNPKNKHQVTLVIDPNSPTFPTTYKNLLNDVQTNVFSVKWVLLDYLKPNGPNTASAIMQAENPLKALADNAEHYNINSQTGGFTSNTPAVKQTIKQLQAHWDFVQRFNLYHLPLTLFAAHNDVHIFHGFTLDETIESYYQ